MFEESPFFRIGDSVTVKSMSEILETRGVHHSRGTNHHFYCMYKNTPYEVFNGDTDLIGKTGVVEGGIYDPYLRVRIDGKLCLFPHFALKLNK